ncbi:DUF6443 domain-containing protein [Flavitalea antarctica]
MNKISKPASTRLMQLLAIVLVAILFHSKASAQCYDYVWLYQVYPYGALCAPQAVSLRAEASSANGYNGEFRLYSSQFTSYPMQTGSTPGNNYYDFYVNATQGGEVWVSYYDYNYGCETYRTQYSFVISPAPVVTQTYAKVCNGLAKIQLGSNVSGSTFYLYKWQNSQYEYQGSNSTGYFEVPAFNPADQYLYYGYAYSNNGCGNASYLGLYFDIGNVQIPTITGPTTLCTSTPTTLVANGNASYYRWYNNANTQLAQASQYAVPTNLSIGAHTFKVKGFSTNGCESGFASITINISTKPIDGTITANKSKIYLGESVTITSQGGLGTPYYWCSNNGGVNWNVFTNSYGGQYSFVHTPAATGTYTYHLRNRTDCGFCFEGGANNTCEAYSAVTVKVEARENMNFMRMRQFNKVGVTTEYDAAALEDTRDVVQSTQYFDGLGRSVQTVTKKAADASGDLVTGTEYDAFGREWKQYLPYASGSTDGKFKPNAQTELAGFYTTQLPGEIFLYSQNQFENSPLNRVSKYTPAGNAWTGSDRGVATKLLVNTTADVVRIWEVAPGSSGNFGTYSTPGSYLEGELSKKITIDENQKQVIEFTDKSGLIILKKVQLVASADNGAGQNHDGWLCTYYVYDDLSKLRSVIQPRGVELLIQNGWDINSLAGDILKEQCFRYEYDARGRMVMKKVPGAGEVWMVYDRWDRLIMTQDANLRQGKFWLTTKYDEFNRPIMTAKHYDGTNTTIAAINANIQGNLGAYSRFEQRNNLTAPCYSLSLSYPTVSSPELLTATYYDDYAWVGMYGASHLRSTEHDQFFLGTGSAPYPQPPAQSSRLNGLVTGLWQTAGALSTRYYDAEGRIIQTRAYNQTGNWDVLSNQYSWVGQPLINVSKTVKGGSNAQTTEVISKISYDALNRLEKVEKRYRNTLVNGNALTGFQTIVHNEYNRLSQLKKKTLGSTLQAPLEYDYNIRGWLLHLNKTYLQNTNSRERWFGYEVAYDNNQTLFAGSTYANPQFNGNIGGIIWKSNGDMETRSWDYIYDASNRLTSAVFNQFTSNYFNKLAGVDFTTSGIAYDANGNIAGMKHKGMLAGKIDDIDDLVYQYIPNTNRLKFVRDLENNENSVLGDFKESTVNNLDNLNNNTADYDYDDNGNLKEDKNKKIQSISYNYLNMPEIITMTGKGTITFSYDALGNKLKKVVAESGKSPKTTMYLNGLVFEDDVLQFIPHEEGRIRFTPATGQAAAKLNYDYFIKDHLGNTRMVLTEEQQQDIYVAATLEGNINTSTDAIYKEREYYSIDPLKLKPKPSGMPTYQNNNGNPPYNPNTLGNTNANNAQVYELKASGGAGISGLGIALKVMSGDEIVIFGKSYYAQNGTGNNYQVPVLSLLEGFVGAGSNLLAAKGVTGLGLNTIPAITDVVDDFLSDGNRNNGTAPRAHINWVFFDEQFRYVDGGFDGVATTGGFKSHNTGLKTVPKNGYVYIYASNESDVEVYFDNLQVIHNRGPLLEETHYYPFGLTMAGISSKAAGKMENRFKFNKGTELDSKEFSDGSGLELYSTEFRKYDPQVGRFWHMDPIDGGFRHLSPYNFANNNPILLIDPSGLLSDSLHPDVLPEVIVYAFPKTERRFPGFYWPTSTKKEISDWRREKYQYDFRRQSGQRVLQGGESELYKSNVESFARRYQAEEDGRKMALGAVVAIASPIVIAAAPEIIAATQTAIATTQSAISVAGATIAEAGIATNFYVQMGAYNMRNVALGAVLRNIPLSASMAAQLTTVVNSTVDISARTMFTTFTGIQRVLTTINVMEPGGLPSDEILFPRSSVK